jgi:hypothetical protein
MKKNDILHVKVWKVATILEIYIHFLFYKHELELWQICTLSEKVRNFK